MRRAILMAGLLMVGCGNAVTPPTPQIIYVTPAPSGAGPTPQIIYVTPAPTAAPLSTPEPTPEPSRSLGAKPGVINFGVQLDEGTHEIPSPTRRFKRTWAQICFSAYLTEPSRTSVTLLVYRNSRVINKFGVDVTNPDLNLVAACADLAGQVNNLTGTYEIRLTGQGKTLAKGAFTLVE